LEYRRRNTRRGRDVESEQQSIEGENVAESEDEDGDEHDRATPPRSR
jgi:integrator complex subunit 11